MTPAEFACATKVVCLSNNHLLAVYAKPESNFKFKVRVKCTRDIRRAIGRKKFWKRVRECDRLGYNLNDNDKQLIKSLINGVGRQVRIWLSRTTYTSLEQTLIIKDMGNVPLEECSYDSSGNLINLTPPSDAVEISDFKVEVQPDNTVRTSWTAVSEEGLDVYRLTRDGIEYTDQPGEGARATYETFDTPGFGDFTYGLSASTQDGNSEELGSTTVTIQESTEDKIRIENFQITNNGVGNVAVTWASVKEEGLDVYRLLRDGVEVGDNPAEGAGASYEIDDSPGNGTFNYTLIANLTNGGTMQVAIGSIQLQLDLVN